MRLTVQALQARRSAGLTDFPPRGEACADDWLASDQSGRCPHRGVAHGASGARLRQRIRAPRSSGGHGTSRPSCFRGPPPLRGHRLFFAGSVPISRRGRRNPLCSPCPPGTRAADWVRGGAVTTRRSGRPRLIRAWRAAHATRSSCRNPTRSTVLMAQATVSQRAITPYRS